MGKIDDEVKVLKEQVDSLNRKMDQTNHYLIQVINQLKALIEKGGGAVAGGGGTVSVDLGPIVERIDNLEKALIRKEDLDELKEAIRLLASEEKKQAQETVVRLTSLFEQGLELIKLENTLDDVKSLLEEAVLSEE